MSYRTFSPNIKSLLHFDYPYYAELNDGLNDEILGPVWTRQGNVKLVGSEIPADSIVSGTPKFGYRCLQTAANSDYITCTTNVFTLAPSTTYQFSFWVRLSATQAGNIITLLNNTTTVLNIGITSENKLTLSIPGSNFSMTTSATLTLNTWTYCKATLTASQCLLSVGGQGQGVNLTRSAITSTACRIGGINGCIDEFMFMTGSTDGVPSEPTQGVLSVAQLGGFGTGALGNVTIASDCVMNTTAGLYSYQTAVYHTKNVKEGKFGGLAVGQEVMILNDNGEYCFRNVLAYSGDIITFSPRRPDIDNPSQIIVMPNFNTLTINAGVTVSPNAWDGTSGGIVAFRVKGDCTINGSIITSGKGRTRSDMLQLTHAGLIDNFITNTGGGIFIVCGGKFTTTSSARLGATWSGSLTGGTVSAKSDGTPGGAGYGGGGASDSDNGGLGGVGGVGGGGGGGDGARGGQAGQAGQSGPARGAAGTGGGGAAHGDTPSGGGTQGVNVNSPDAGSATGGGGAGGNSGRCVRAGTAGASSGSNIVLIAHTLKVDEASISTGGAGGKHTNVTSGGGGTGFAYIAAKTLA